MLTKPTKKEDLFPPIHSLEEHDWEKKLKQFLSSFDVPLPEPVTINEIETLENKLKKKLPKPLNEFLRKIGPLHLDIKFLNLDKILLFNDISITKNLNSNDQKYVSELIAFADHLGSGDFYGIDPEGNVCLVSHDPLAILGKGRSFFSMLEMMLIDLYTGYYGWPDKEIIILADQAKQEKIGYTCFR